MTSASRSKGEDVAPDFGRVPSEPGSREPSPDGLDPSGFDPSRLSERKAITQYLIVRAARAVLNRHSLPWWSFRQRALAYWIGIAHTIAAQEIEQGRHVLESSLWIVDIQPGVLFTREAERCDSDGSGEAGKTGTGLTEGDSVDPKGIAPAVSHLTDQEGQNR
jgi:hypothetical protein